MSQAGALAAGPPASAGVRRDRIGVVIACLIGNLVSPTPIVYGALSVFLVPIARDFAWPREQVSVVFILLSVVTALAYPLVGRIADRFGSRRPILFGNLAFGACVMALGLQTGDAGRFYLVFALIGAFGALPSSMMFTRVVSGWFDQTRGTMLGITAGLGNGLGAVIMPPLALLLMSRFGWRGGFIGLGALVILVGFPTLLLGMKEAPLSAKRAAAQLVDAPGLGLVQSAKTASFWLLLTAICLGAGCLTAVLAHIVPMLTDRHVPVGQATLVVSTFAMVTAVWQIVMGWLLDRTGSPKLVAPLYLVSVIGLILLERSGTFPALLAAGALLGIGMGTEYGVLPYFVSRYFGLRRFGAIAGVMYGAVFLAQGFTPFLMDVDYDHHRAYVLSLHMIDALLVGGAAIIACLPTYAAARARWAQG